MKYHPKIILATVLFFVMFTGNVEATTPPNSPRQVTPSHNPGWSDTSAFDPTIQVDFTWQNNGDAESSPLWFYFNLMQWNGTD